MAFLKKITLSSPKRAFSNGSCHKVPFSRELPIAFAFKIVFKNNDITRHEVEPRPNKFGNFNDFLRGGYRIAASPFFLFFAFVNRSCLGLDSWRFRILGFALAVNSIYDIIKGFAHLLVNTTLNLFFGFVFSAFEQFISFNLSHTRPKSKAVKQQRKEDLFITFFDF